MVQTSTVKAGSRADAWGPSAQLRTVAYCAPWCQGPGSRVPRRTVHASFADGSQALGLAGGCDQVSFEGFLPPIGGADATGGSARDPVGSYKLKSTVPIKMRLTCGGVPVTTGSHRLQVAKPSSATTSDTPIDATPTEGATTATASG